MEIIQECKKEMKKLAFRSIACFGFVASIYGAVHYGSLAMGAETELRKTPRERHPEVRYLDSVNSDLSDVKEYLFVPRPFAEFPPLEIVSNSLYSIASDLKEHSFSGLAEKLIDLNRSLPMATDDGFDTLANDDLAVYRESLSQVQNAIAKRAFILFQQLPSYEELGNTRFYSGLGFFGFITLTIPSLYVWSIGSKNNLLNHD